MRDHLKNKNVDLRQLQPLFFQISLMVVLTVFLILFNLEFKAEIVDEITLDRSEEVVELAPVIQTDQNIRSEKPPVPAKPQVPVELPNDRIIEDQIVMLDIVVELDTHIDLPSSAANGLTSPPGTGQEGVVEALPPDIEKGTASIAECIRYPTPARNAEVEGRVVVTFVVNQQGGVENTQIIMGIGYGANEETLRCVSQGDFSRDGNPVQRTRLQYVHNFILRGRP